VSARSTAWSCWTAGRVLGWSISHIPGAALTTNALAMTIERRESVPGKTVIHSDHGTQPGLNRSLQHRFVDMTIIDWRTPAEAFDEY